MKMTFLQAECPLKWANLPLGNGIPESKKRILSDTQGFGLLGTASADGYFPAESGWGKDAPIRILAGLETVAHT